MLEGRPVQSYRLPPFAEPGRSYTAEKHWQKIVWFELDESLKFDTL
jgi:hypothetical protein